MAGPGWRSWEQPLRDRGDAAGAGGSSSSSWASTDPLSPTAGSRSSEGEGARLSQVHRPAEMQKLLGEFRALYQERLRRLDETSNGSEEMLRLKLRILQSYVDDLSEQNDVLVQTMEEIEGEANRKVTSLETKLQEYVSQATEYKQENRNLQLTKENLVKEISNLRSRLLLSEEELESLRQMVSAQRLDRPCLPRLPVPTKHLSGSTATHPISLSQEQSMEQEELRCQLASKEQLILCLQEQLRDMAYTQEKSREEVEDREHKIQQLQETITELHHEISLKESENLTQLQDLHLLENRIKTLSQKIWQSEETITQLQTELEQVQGGLSDSSHERVSPHVSSSQESLPHSSRANELLKAELERRDATILHLQKDVLLLQEKRDGLLAELDAQEQRIYQLQAELKGKEAELEQKQNRILHLHQELETSVQLYEDSRKQVSESKTCLSRVEGENQTLRTCQLQQTAELEKLNATIQDLKVSARDADTTLQSEAVERQKEMEKRLLECQAEVQTGSEVIHSLRLELQESNQRAEDIKSQLHGVRAKMESVRSEYSMTLRKGKETEEQLRTLEHIHKDLRVTVSEQQETMKELETKLEQQLESLYLSENKMVRQEQNLRDLEAERSRLQEHCQELQAENSHLYVRLDTQSLAVEDQQTFLSRELSKKDELIEKLKKEQLSLQHKVAQCEIKRESLHQELNMVNSERASLEETTQSLKTQLQKFRAQYQEASEEVKSCREQMQELRRKLSMLEMSQDSAERSLQFKEEAMRELQTEKETLHQTLKDLRAKLVKKEEKLSISDLECGSLRLKLQSKSEEAQQLREQLHISQDALQRVTQELKDFRREAETEIAKGEEKLTALQEEISQLQKQYSTCYNELLHNEEAMEKLKSELTKVNEDLNKHTVSATELSAQREKLDIELTVLTEKHKTAQQEVR
nr:PREDICTED: early endosome antigen 1-like [Latimeria chalumnae]|eukprot:XP_014346335.1 PREDICTED: early endosome antigen 1-like [Latimeria chalumnae]